jgi:hypothetical protein
MHSWHTQNQLYIILLPEKQKSNGIYLFLLLYFYRVVQFTQLLVVRVEAELAAELAEIAVHVDAVLAIRTDEPFLVDVAQRR